MIGNQNPNKVRKTKRELFRFRAKYCQHQFATERHCSFVYRLDYWCSDCGAEWEDEWSCLVDGDCPECGVSASPYKHDVIGLCACELLPKR